ncbi:MAG: hypothetical protein ACTSVY_14735 [Candidatus Helarchaeota archaeon]
MLHGIFVYTDGGQLLFSKNMAKNYGNPNLISSLFSAINMFSNSIKGGDVNSIEMDNYALVGIKSSRHSIRFISIIDKGDEVTECINFLNTCEESFVSNFSEDLREVERTHIINTDTFQAWEKDLLKLISDIDFTPIESVMGDLIKEISLKIQNGTIVSGNKQVEPQLVNQITERTPSIKKKKKKKTKIKKSKKKKKKTKVKKAKKKKKKSKKKIKGKKTSSSQAGKKLKSKKAKNLKTKKKKKVKTKKK